MEPVADKPVILYIYMKLVSSFSRIEGFEGWVIAKAEFKIYNSVSIINNPGMDGEVPVNIEFVKQRKNYSVISACTVYKNLGYTVTMYILKPHGISSKSVAGGADEAPEILYPGFSYLFTLKYTIKNIKSFTEFTGDSNPIHQVALPVVPGFLMFGDIIRKELYQYTTINKEIKFVISFRKPIFANEQATVYKADGNGKIYIITQV